MSMILALRTLSDSNINKVVNDPPLIWKVVAPDDPEFYESARSERTGRRTEVEGMAYPGCGLDASPLPDAAALARARKPSRAKMLCTWERTAEELISSSSEISW